MSQWTQGPVAQQIAFSHSAMGLGEFNPDISYFERDGDRVMKVSDVAVFRSGTFRDMYGEETTYSDEDMDLLVRNFSYLRDQGILPKVPVRKGHKSFGQNPMDSLIGYVTGINAVKKKIANGREFTFLSADYEILDKDAQEKVKTGLFVNRSAEIGRYRDNDNVEHAPTFLGFAYVDFSAVQFLNEYAKEDPSNSKISVMMEEVMPEQAKGPKVEAPPAPKEFQAPTPVMQEFSLDGNRVSDPVQVQNYINTLETSNREYAQAEIARVQKDREAYVESLVDGKKLAATAKDSTLSFAKSLTSEQYSAWQEQYKNAPELPILGDHGYQNHEQGKDAPVVDVAEKQFSTDVEVVRQFALGGMSHDKIKRGQAYARVIAKDPTFVIPQPGYGS